MGKSQAPQAAAPEATKEAPAEAAKPISFEEPAAPQVAKVEFADEKPKDFVNPVPTGKALDQIHAEAVREDTKRDFAKKIIEARKPQPEPEFAPPPLAPRVASQTQAEIEAGRAMVAKHEAQQALRRPAPPTPEETGSKPVFRPGDYVPDQKKGQGYTQARNL